MSQPKQVHNEDSSRGYPLDESDGVFEFETEASDSQAERKRNKYRKPEVTQNCTPLYFDSDSKTVLINNTGKAIGIKQQGNMLDSSPRDGLDSQVIGQSNPDHIVKGFALPGVQTSKNMDKNGLATGNLEDTPDELLDEEDLYDKFVPTDRTKVEDYERQFEREDKEHHKLEDYTYEEPKKNASDDTIIHIKRPIGMYMPPENFAMHCSSIYRSSFPRVENFEFLKTLGLKAILCLIPEEYPSENIEFNNRNGIKFFQLGLSGNKEPFVKIKPDLVTEALKIITNPENQPILIHCNRGKHRTGCIVGCVRKLQNWSLSMIFDEYRKFAYPKERPLDQQFIEMYDDSDIVSYATKRHWLPLEW